MFICKLCDDCLSSKQEILGTYCGHVFHQECLDHHLSQKGNCPTCSKSLKVDLSGYAVLSLYPEERKRKDERKTMQENAMLKQRLVDVIQALIIMQKELKSKSEPSSPKSPAIPAPAYSTRKPKNEGQPKMSMSDMIINDILHTSTEIVYDCDQGHEGDDLISSELLVLRDKFSTGNTLSDYEKTRILRSKRREYLTWRNKAQSWLSKMEGAAHRLLQSQQGFTNQQYLHELRFFFNKIYNQGRIIERTKEAATIYLIIDNLKDDEIQEIQEKVNSMADSYTNVMTALLNHINFLEVENSEVESRRNSSSDEKETVIEFAPVPKPRKEVVLTISGIESDSESYKTPVFV